MLVTVNEDLIRATADLLISSGLQKAGYHYLVIDGVLPHERNLLSDI